MLLGLSATMLLLGFGCTNPSKALVDNPQAVEGFARRATHALQVGNAEWLRERMVPPQGFSGGIGTGLEATPTAGSDSAAGPSPVSNLGTGFIEEWAAAEREFGMLELLRIERDSSGAQGPLLWFRNFDGERPVYLRLALGQAPMPANGYGRDSLVIADWTEYPGAMSMDQRWSAMEQLRAALGPEVLSQTVFALVEASRQSEAENPSAALDALDRLPETAKAHPLVVAERLRVLSDAGHSRFPEEALASGHVLEAPAMAHLAFSWSLRARDGDGLRRATGDLQRQFGADTLLRFYTGLAAEWAGDCASAEAAYADFEDYQPDFPLLPWAGLNCQALDDPQEALDQILDLVSGSGLPLDDLDAWIAQSVPSLHRSALYKEWRLAAGEVL